MHAKYEVPIYYGSKVLVKVKVYFAPDTQTTERQTGQKLDAIEFHCGGIQDTYTSQ